MKISISTGNVFGRLKAISPTHETYASGRKKLKWRCRCECGAVVNVAPDFLVHGKTRSCGCLIKHVAKARITHGHCTGKQTPEYRAWRHAINRCYNEKDPRYPNYGGRGIKMHPAWRNSFECFIRDMGRRPAGKTLERKDNNGDYAPGNCRWATYLEQANNKTKNVMLEFAGKKLPMSEWARITGFGYGAIQARIARKWSVEKTLTTTPKARRNQHV